MGKKTKDWRETTKSTTWPIHTQQLKGTWRKARTPDVQTRWEVFGKAQQEIPNVLLHFGRYLWGLQHAPPCRRRRRRHCWHRLLLSGWQMPEQDVSSQTGLSCESVSSCDTQHLHEMRCIAVNREDLPLRGRGMRVRLISGTINSLHICALSACPGTLCLHALRLPSPR